MESVIALVQCVALVFEGDVKDLSLVPLLMSMLVVCHVLKPCDFKCAHVLNLVHIARILLKHST